MTMGQAKIHTLLLILPEVKSYFDCFFPIRNFLRSLFNLSYFPAMRASPTFTPFQTQSSTGSFCYTLFTVSRSHCPKSSIT